MFNFLKRITRLEDLLCGHDRYLCFRTRGVIDKQDEQGEAIKRLLKRVATLEGELGKEFVQSETKENFYRDKPATRKLKGA